MARMAQFVLINPVGTRYAGEVLDTVQDGQDVITQLASFGGVLVPLPNAQLRVVGNNDEATAMMQAAYASSTAIAGGGTAGKVPLWTGVANLGDSVLTQVGTKIGVNVPVPTASLSLPAGVAAAASLNVATGVAPTVPNAGDLWFDGSYLYLRAAGTNQPLNAPFGTGTTGTIPVWSSGTTLGDSIVTQTGTSRVNIGSGGYAGASVDGLRLVNGANSYIAASDGTRTLLMGANGAQVLVGSLTNHALVLKTNNIDAVTILPGAAGVGGNVGIGTASPTTFAASGSVVLGQNISSQQWALKIFGGNDANRAPVISLFRAGNAEAIIGQIKDGVRGVLAIGTGGGVASFNDATLATYSQLKIGTDYADMSGSGYGLKLPATPGNADAQTLDAYNQNTSWSPTVTWGTGGTVTTTSATGAYTQIGNVVTFTVTIGYNCSVVPTGGSISVDLPRTSASGFNQRPGMWAFNSFNGTAGSNFLSIGGGVTTAQLRVATATGTADIATNLTVTASGALVVTATYLAS
jgi:hypothetical protein